MTKREQWMRIGKAFEKYHETGVVGWRPNTSYGLCAATMDLEDEIERDAQLSRIRSTTFHWFACNQKNAALRALFAYFLAEGMGDD